MSTFVQEFTRLSEEDSHENLLSSLKYPRKKHTYFKSLRRPSLITTLVLITFILIILVLVIVMLALAFTLVITATQAHAQ